MRVLAALVAFAALWSAGMGQGYAKQDPKQEKQTLARLEQGYATAKKQFTRSPKSPAAKKGFVAAAVRLGTANMTAQTLDRKVKYKVALRYYREALKLDPKNAEAKANHDMIVSIYKSMGRPVPKD
jgi:hypothetical protein